jgi:hypothetical protein
MKSHHNIYTILVSAPVVRFLYRAAKFVWTGEFNQQRNLSYILKCMNACYKCPENYSYRLAMKISKPIYVQYTPVQHAADSNI